MTLQTAECRLPIHGLAIEGLPIDGLAIQGLPIDGLTIGVPVAPSGCASSRSNRQLTIDHPSIFNRSIVNRSIGNSSFGNLQPSVGSVEWAS